MTDWRPSISGENLQARSKILHAVRSHFANTGAIEVTTPVAGRHGVSDVHLENIRTADGRFLQTSPEYAMKRLLAAHPVAMYQVCPAFRGGESGERHNSEFTMLEWYRPGGSLETLMDDCETLYNRTRDAIGLEPRVVDRIAYADLFVDKVGIAPHQLSLDELRDFTRGRLDCSHIAQTGDDAERADYLDRLFSTLVEPDLENPTFVIEFPSCQAALARLSDDGQRARRFELFVSGNELVNGYDELNDSEELTARFDANNTARRRRGLAEVEPDTSLLSSLAGLGHCAGAAMGIERLLMALTGASTIGEVMAFTDQSF